MKLLKLKIDNLISFQNFENGKAFKVKNLIFGVNGSGKSTLVTLLSTIDRYKNDKTKEKETELKEFFSKRISKENPDKDITVEFEYDTAKLVITYSPLKNELVFSNDHWAPIKVFNDLYTERNIGNEINFDIKDNGLVFGEKHKDLKKHEKKKDDVKSDIKKNKEKFDEIVNQTIEKYKDVTGSESKIENTINFKALIAKECEYEEDHTLITKRGLLGTGDPELPPELIIKDNFKLNISFADIESLCREKVTLPHITKALEHTLKEYTAFYNDGIEIYEKNSKPKCPFCSQDWLNAEERIKSYRDFLESHYSKARQQVLTYIDIMESYKTEIESLSKQTKKLYLQVANQSEKYSISIQDWKDIEYSNDTHFEIVQILKNKYDNMDFSLTLEKKLQEHETLHIDQIKRNNKIIEKIKEGALKIANKRKDLNQKLGQHYMKNIWKASEKNRETYYEHINSLKDIEKKITELENRSKLETCTQRVFNGFLKLLGITEYELGKDNVLNLHIDKRHDISAEGQRISTAQRKMLSLCYYFADVVASVDDVQELNNYILMFDDPVDSADYIYFYGISTLIEHAPKLISSVLEQAEIKLAQTFVFTHNTLLQDRISSTWNNKSLHLIKNNNISQYTEPVKKVNYYAIYLKEIIQYYKSPEDNENKMIYIGNLIRRVLEILASFNQLDSNDIRLLAQQTQSQKLTLIANHMSHESFVKIMNPMPKSEDLQQACKDIIKLIESDFPRQYRELKSKYALDIK